MQTLPLLLIVGLPANTELYPGTSKLLSLNEILESK